MFERSYLLHFWVDLIVPIGAIVVICFALGSVVADPAFRIAGKPPHEILKAHRLPPEIAVP